MQADLREKRERIIKKINREIIKEYKSRIKDIKE